MLSPTKQQCYDILEDARKDYAKIKRIVSEIPVKSAYTYAVKYIDPRIPTQIEESGSSISEMMCYNGMRTLKDFLDAIYYEVEDYYGDNDNRTENTIIAHMASAIYGVQIECANRIEAINNVIKSYEPKTPQIAVEQCQLLGKEIKNALRILNIIKQSAKIKLSEYVDEERFEKRENLKDRKNERVGRKMDATRGLMHIHASRHPTAIRAHKTTPKRKNGICRLENSVRRMF